LATDGQYGPDDYSPPDWFWQIAASKFVEGAVKPWEWSEVSVEWLNQTLVVMDCFAHVRQIKEREHR
jgi:hypothetical protein